MIGVAANSEYSEIVSEFFELFKTAWEFYHSGGKYDAVICCGVIPADVRANLIIVYSPDELEFDRQHQLHVSGQTSADGASYRGRLFPVYSGLGSIENRHDSNQAKTKSSLACEVRVDGQYFVRVGYDLFSEVRHLLCHGQPLQHAAIPSIEIHIAILRDLLVEYRIAFDEVPPTPAGYNFIVCLTHDVDHFSIRNHKCDHTLFGFLYRASVGSLTEFVQRRKTLRQLARNWIAILSLPLVYLRVLPDFWSKLERYLELDPASTFFVIPKKGEAGLTPTGTRCPWRAARYDLSQLQGGIQEILARHGEVAVHGIDAWRDVAKARSEKDEIQALTQSSEIGVRMHWLFFDSESAVKLEQAGFSYDSTFGYNETVGYRAGTTQAFMPPGTKRILELPLHIMDTALFFPSHLHLTSEQATTRVDAIINDMKQFGGVLTVNWHDRSIAPERLWDDFYLRLVAKLGAAGAWFCTASQASMWFRRRRAVDFQGGKPKIAFQEQDLPGLRSRSYPSEAGAEVGPSKYGTAPSPGVLRNNAKEIATAI